MHMVAPFLKKDFVEAPKNDSNEPLLRGKYQYPETITRSKNRLSRTGLTRKAVWKLRYKLRPAMGEYLHNSAVL